MDDLLPLLMLCRIIFILLEHVPRDSLFPKLSLHNLGIIQRGTYTLSSVGQ